MLPLHHAQQQNDGRGTICILRSCSGDIDIPVILIASYVPDLQVFIDSGTSETENFYLAASDLLATQTKPYLACMRLVEITIYRHFLKKARRAVGSSCKARKNSSWLSQSWGHQIIQQMI